VDHSQGVPGAGTFLLHQGIQRRIAVTLVHEDDPDIAWTDIRELVVGRVRNTPDCKEPDVEHTVLSLNLLPAQYVEQPDDDRYTYIHTYIHTYMGVQFSGPDPTNDNRDPTRPDQ